MKLNIAVSGKGRRGAIALGAVTCFFLAEHAGAAVCNDGSEQRRLATLSSLQDVRNGKEDEDRLVKGDVANEPGINNVSAIDSLSLSEQIVRAGPDQIAISVSLRVDNGPLDVTDDLRAGDVVTLSATHRWEGAPYRIIRGAWLIDGEVVQRYSFFTGNYLSSTVTSHAGSWRATPGAHTLSFAVDPDGEIAEAREENNVISRRFVVGEAFPDLILQHTNGSIGAWYMNGTILERATLLNPHNVGDLGWHVVGMGAFNDDGQPDLILQHTDGSLAASFMLGSSRSSMVSLNPAATDPNWRVTGAGDLNADGNADLIFQHTNGMVAAWLMEGINLGSATLLDPPFPGAGWEVRGVGQFDGDGNLDILFQHTDGHLAVWLMHGTRLNSAALLNPSHPGDADWRVVGASDFNNDTKSDLTFQHANGALAAWLMDGVTLSSASLLSPSFPGAGWRLAAP